VGIKREEGVVGGGCSVVEERTTGAHAICVLSPEKEDNDKKRR
jgi:hypothetical protein